MGEEPPYLKPPPWSEGRVLSTLLPNIENSELLNENQKETKTKKGKRGNASRVFCKTSTLSQDRMWNLHVLKLHISIKKNYDKSTWKNFKKMQQHFKSDPVTSGRHRFSRNKSKHSNRCAMWEISCNECTTEVDDQPCNVKPCKRLKPRC